MKEEGEKKDYYFLLLLLLLFIIYFLVHYYTNMIVSLVLLPSSRTLQYYSLVSTIDLLKKNTHRFFHHQSLQRNFKGIHIQLEFVEKVVHKCILFFSAKSLYVYQVMPHTLQYRAPFVFSVENRVFKSW